jgi:hypothetical protein
LYPKSNTMKKDYVSEKIIGDHKVRTFIDNDPESPRDWCNLGTMICFHGRYKLGDKHSYDSNDYSGWEEMKENIIDTENVHTILPLYLYDHSGITMNTTGFSCNWDSGQVGWIFVSKEVVMKEGIDETKVEEYLKNEVKTYDQYLRGDVYGYEIVKVTTCDLGHEHEEVVDSSYGYYGEDDCMENGVDYLVSCVV